MAGNGLVTAVEPGRVSKKCHHAADGLPHDLGVPMRKAVTAAIYLGHSPDIQYWLIIVILQAQESPFTCPGTSSEQSQLTSAGHRSDKHTDRPLQPNHQPQITALPYSWSPFSTEPRTIRTNV